MRIKTYSVLLLAGLAAACQTAPKTAAEVIDRCEKRVTNWDLSVKNEAAVYMRVSKDRMPRLLCQRIVVAIQKGRLKPEQLDDLDRRGSPVWKIIKGQ